MLEKPTRLSRPTPLPRVLSGAGAFLIVVALASAGCGKVESCKSGTLFLNVNLGPYTSADQLDIDVSVLDSVDGGGTHHTTLTLKTGSTEGGVEVQFPNGYPAGKTVSVTLTLRSGASQLAQRVVSIPTLPPSCTALGVDFAAVDGGAGGSSGGASGNGGSAGRGGVAGASGGASGAGGPGGNGTGGGGAGAGGRAGTAGGGAGGPAGTAGGGRGGGGASGASGGTGGSCVPTGVENCFNNIDDDCDGKIDCADPDCTPKAQCVTADPTSAPIGTLTGSGAGTTCPAGYDKTTAIMSNLNALDCTTGGSCSCRPPAVTCSTTLVSYNAPNLCNNVSGVGQKAGTFSTGDDKTCSIIPAWSTAVGGDIYGIQTTKFTATAAGGCIASGAPNTPTPTWSTKGTFCATTTIGGGCGTGQVCVPVAAGASLCQLFDGAKTTCPGGAPAVPWYTGTTGAASCGPCTCGSTTGASCDNVLLTYGSDYGCSGFGTISSGGTSCFASGIYEPGVAFTGTPTSPTCPAQSAYTGNIAPSGPKTLCCP